MAADPNSQAAWWDVWAKLKNIIAQLDTTVANLKDSEAYAMNNPMLRDEYQNKMSEVQSLYDKAVWLRDNIKSALAYFGVNLSGAGEALAGLGLAPLLIWPLVIAGVTWLGSKALDLYQFSQRVEEQKRLESKGNTPQQAASIIASNVNAGSITGAVSNISTLLTIGGILAALWYWGRRV